MVVIAIMVAIMIVVLVSIPVALFMPTVFFPVPPRVISIPAILPFGIQVALPVENLMAAGTVVPQRIIVVPLRFGDSVLAIGPIIGRRALHSRAEQEQAENRGRQCQCANSQHISS
ncbi:MAG TPA: hypothetical protein VEG30_11060 [Terriglobales bacterium]|nr:hypothetical protein [Terriglobales bacterium]